MSGMQSPAHALGIMVMSYHNRIIEFLPEVLIHPEGPKKVYPLIVTLNAILYSYWDTMHVMEQGDDGKPVQVKYWKKIVDLKKRKNDLSFDNINDNVKWMDWFEEYITLSSSCFNQIGLAMPKDWQKDEDDENDEPYLPDEPKED